MNDELTTRLSRELHEQVDDWHDTPLTLDGVMGRARSIRRTRRVVAGGAVAAVLAIAAPLAITASGGLDARPDRDLPPATSTPSQGVDSADPEPDGSGIAIPYLQGRTLTLPDGTETELPRAYDGFAVLGDRVLATWIDTDDGSVTLDRIEDGEVVESEGITAMVSNPEGDAVAFVRADGELVVESASGRAGLGYHEGVRPVRLLGSAPCGGPEGGCLVFVDDQGTPAVISGPDDVSGLPGDPLAVADAVAEQARVAMLMSVDDLEPGSCSRVVSNNGAQGTLFETCDYALDRFSPDGAHLAAGPAYRSGIGDAFAAILDAGTGEELNRVEPEEGFVNRVAWEDADHLLAIVHDWSAGTWTVERLGADGTTETVLGPVEGGEMKPPWRLGGAD